MLPTSGLLPDGYPCLDEGLAIHYGDRDTVVPVAHGVDVAKLDQRHWQQMHALLSGRGDADPQLFAPRGERVELLIEVVRPLLVRISSMATVLIPTQCWLASVFSSLSWARSNRRLDRPVEFHGLVSRYAFVANSAWFEHLFGQYAQAGAAVLTSKAEMAARDRGAKLDPWQKAKGLLEDA